MDLAGAIDAAADGVHCALNLAQKGLLTHYVALVFKWNRIANLTGAEDPETFVARHLGDSLALSAHITGSHVVDVGSGAGLPGVVLACLRSDWQLTLLEPRGKRARFLAQVCLELPLPNAQPRQSRVEDWRPARPPDTIVSQALANVETMLALTRHLHSPGLRLIIMKGEDPAPELASLPAGSYELRVETLSVPGRRARHLVIVDW